MRPDDAVPRMRAARAVASAAVLVAAVALAGANFVLVDVRLLAFDVETRLAWVMLVPALAAFVAGALHERCRAARARRRGA
jgi:hypothetical protein